MIDPQDYYSKRKEIFEVRVTSLKKKAGWISFFRLLSMVLFIYFLVKGINSGYFVWYTLAAFSLISFIMLVNHHRNLKLSRDRSQAMADINENELSSLGGDFSMFADGREYLDDHHEFTYDLDIFGKKSIFQFLNRTCTLEGKKHLAYDLLNSPFQRDQIGQRQEIYRELAGNPDLMQDFRVAGMLAKDNPEDRLEIMEWMNNSHFAFSTGWRIVMYTLPVIFILILSLGWIIPGLFGYLLPLVFVSFFANGLLLTRINKYHVRISRKHEILKKYTDLNRIIAGGEFTHEVLKSHSATAKLSVDKFQNLDTLMNFLDTRLNVLVGVILNLFFFFDLHIIRLLEEWRLSSRERLDGFFRVPASVDSAISFATCHFNNPGFCWPVIVETGLEATDLGHPLIPEEIRVVNDLVTGDGKRIFMITGANMAGKSTFLRTLGVNMILAGAGAPVCSSAFRFEPLAVITGMRTTDSLAESESYFFAELKRLKRIVEMLKNGDKILILLDEILKGTNSTDKHNGSVALVKKFAENDCLALIATHDLSMGQLAESFPATVLNLHFESYIEGSELKFDYRLRQGIAVNMNASFLMKKMGIIE